MSNTSTDKFDFYVDIAGTNYPLVAAGTLLLADMKFAAQMQAACMHATIGVCTRT